MNKITNADVYAKVTDAIVAALDKGVAPWRKPWTGHGPKNLISKKEYRGANVFLLMCTPFTSPWWLTYNQARSLGGHVKRGEKGTTIIFWQIGKREHTDASGVKEMKKFFLLRYYTVFNVEQTEGIDPKKIPSTEVRVVSEAERISAAEAIANDYTHEFGGPNVTVVRGSNQAFYSPSLDTINLPDLSQFSANEEYYSTLFHELTHSTGHDTRLKRKFGSSFGNHAYSEEELVAEFGAAFLCGAAGIEKREVLENSAAYLKHWASKLKDNPKWVVQAASAAQKAADHVLGFDREKVEDEAEGETQDAPVETAV